MSRINVANFRHPDGTSDNITLDSSNNAVVAGTLGCTGNLTVTSGNLVLSSGNGIDFSATSGTGTSELLDDYEEGTWTPTVTTGTLSAGNAVYTKVGRLVTCVAQVSNFSDQSSSNEIYLNNLPFTPAANQVVGSCAIRYYNGPDTVPQVQTNGNMFFTKISNTGNFDTATHSDFNSSNGMIYFVATYAAD